MWSAGALPRIWWTPPIASPLRTKTLVPPNRIACTSASAPAPAPAQSLGSVEKKTRYRQSYPGEAKGITEEMRFVAMRLRKVHDGEEVKGDEGDTWQPSMEGLLKYLVDSKVVFDTLEGIVDQSVAYELFRNTGLERAHTLSKDIEHFKRLKFKIPEPSSPGTTYANYLKEISASSAPSFLSHFYNIYLAHLSGGQVIGEQVSKKLLKGRNLEFNQWDSDALAILKLVRNRLNQIGEHWTREDKNKCLRETSKSFRLSGQIVRLIIL